MHVRVFSRLLLAAVPYAAAPLRAQAPGTEIYLAPLARDGGALRVGTPAKVTNRPGYDNQPAFSPDGRRLYYTAGLEGQTEIFRLDLTGDRPSAPVRITTTPESEYSPTVMAGGGRLSVVRVERDSTQRLWSFTLAGTAEGPIFEAIKPVGYHAWAGPEIAYLFVLGTPSSLQRADRRTGRGEVVAHNIGRTIVPSRNGAAITFLARDSAGGTITEIDLASGTHRIVAPALEGGSEFFAWTPAGELLMARGNRLFLRARSDSAWRELAAFAEPGLQRISRLAVSPAGDRVALVGEEPRP
ncbi:MAG: hypothetical protein ACRENB_16580 [Gemmatimonadales bacterium]